MFASNLCCFGSHCLSWLFKCFVYSMLWWLCGWSIWKQWKQINWLESDEIIPLSFHFNRFKEWQQIVPYPSYCCIVKGFDRAHSTCRGSMRIKSKRKSLFFLHRCCFFLFFFFFCYNLWKWHWLFRLNYERYTSSFLHFKIAQTFNCLILVWMMTLLDQEFSETGMSLCSFIFLVSFLSFLQIQSILISAIKRAEIETTSQKKHMIYWTKISVWHKWHAKTIQEMILQSFC